MISLQYDVRVHSTTDTVCIRDTDFGCSQYYDKTTSRDQGERVYSADKCSYTVGRGQRWFLTNRRPERLKTALRELDELILEHSVITTWWRGPSLVQLVLQNSAVVTLVLNNVGDIVRVHIDKYLVGRFAERPTAVWFTERCMLFAFLEPKLTYISFGKPLDFERCESLSSGGERRTVHVDLVSPPGRRLDRHLVVNEEEDLAVVWWSLGDQEVYPWTPQLKEEDRANMLVYSLKPELKLVGFHRTRSEPIFIRFLPGYLIHYIAQNMSDGKRCDNKLENTLLLVENFKTIKKKLSRSVDISSSVLCCTSVPDSDTLLLSTSDGTLLSFDQVENRVEHQTKAGFPATALSVSPDGVVFLALNEKGLVQCFDIALNPVALSHPGEEVGSEHLVDLSQYFKAQILVKDGAWSRQGKPGGGLELGYSHFLVRIQGGPALTLRISSGVLCSGLGPVQVVGQYLRMSLHQQALMLLSQLSWVHLGDSVLTCLSTVFNSLLRLPHSREQETLLEACLGIFLAPAKPITEEIREEYSESVRDLSRRFFNHLLRHHQLVKGFQLAVDLNDYDLFIDVHYAAVRRNLLDLAQAAMIKAKAAYNKNTSEPNSRSGSSQSYPSPFQLFTGTTGELMQPGQPATYLRTTAAKKINTHEFSRSFEEDCAAAEPSFRYESIVSLPSCNTQTAEEEADSLEARSIQPVHQVRHSTPILSAGGLGRSSSGSPYIVSALENTFSPGFQTFQGANYAYQRLHQGSQPTTTVPEVEVYATHSAQYREFQSSPFLPSQQTRYSSNQFILGSSTPGAGELESSQSENQFYIDSRSNVSQVSTDQTISNEFAFNQLEDNQFTSSPRGNQLTTYQTGNNQLTTYQTGSNQLTTYQTGSNQFTSTFTGSSQRPTYQWENSRYASNLGSSHFIAHPSGSHQADGPGTGSRDPAFTKPVDLVTDQFTGNFSEPGYFPSSKDSAVPVFSGGQPSDSRRFVPNLQHSTLSTPTLSVNKTNTINPGVLGSQVTLGTPVSLGTPGTLGTTGTLGTPRSLGTHGTQGTPGTLGTPWTQGTSGTHGTPGTQGTPRSLGTPVTVQNPGSLRTQGSRFSSMPGKETPRPSNLPSGRPNNRQDFGIGNLNLRSAVAGPTTFQERETILSSVVQTRTISRHTLPQYVPPPRPSFKQDPSDKEEIKVIHFGVV